MAPESFYVISTRWVRIMLDLPLGDRFLGRFSWTPPQGAVLVEERHRGPRIAHEASIHVVAWRGRCCANTRSGSSAASTCETAATGAWIPASKRATHRNTCRVASGTRAGRGSRSAAARPAAATCPASSPRRRSRIGAGTPSTTRGRLTSRRCANPGACRPASRDHARVLLSPGSLYVVLTCLTIHR